MMIKVKKMHFKNIKCLHDVEVEFSPMTVLVGPNGSGKSTILNAMAGDIESTNCDTMENFGDFGVMFYPEDGRPFWIGGEVPETLAGFDFAFCDMPENAEPVLAAYSDIAKEDLAFGFAAMLVKKYKLEVSKSVCRLMTQYKSIKAYNPDPEKPMTFAFSFQDRWNDDLWHPHDEVSDGVQGGLR